MRRFPMTATLLIVATCSHAAAKIAGNQPYVATFEEQSPFYARCIPANARMRSRLLNTRTWTFWASHLPRVHLRYVPKSNQSQPRWVKNIPLNLIRRSCLGLTVPRVADLRQAISVYLDHYQRCRNHQGLDNCLLEPGDEVGRMDGEIRCRESLGGLLKYYHRSAA